jgi:signal transduction histidine kinase
VKRPELTIRVRLTLVYGGLFLLAGIVMLAVTFALVQLRGAERSTVIGQAPSASGAPSQQAGSPQVSELPPPTDTVEAPLGGKPPGNAYGVLERFEEETKASAMNALVTQGGIALSVVSAAAIAIGWLIAGRMLQPLHRMTETARRIANTPAADRGLRERIALNGPHDELKELADTFDLMLEHLDHSFDGQRRFIANASHELRTPLTLNRALLEVAVHRGSASPEVLNLGETLLGINARHERLIDGLLLLARSESEIIERSFVDLADIVEHVAEQVPPSSVTITVAAEEAPTTGNPVLLERLVQNLVENGVRHNIASDGWVRVTSGTNADGWAVVEVSNSGPTVPKYEIPNLFEPFRRLGAERVSTAPGAGLGLSIVQAVARAHGGDVRADPRDGGGLTVTVTLPAAPSP